MIIPVHNEATELRRTVSSVRRTCTEDTEIIVIDDGSNNDRCRQVAEEHAVVKQLESRKGVAYCRNLGVGFATGDCFAFVDAHQKFTSTCLNECGNLARTRNAIVCSVIKGYAKDEPPLHGAVFRRRRNAPPFGAEWNLKLPPGEVSRINSLRAPAYVIPRSVYEKVRWSSLLRGWGGSEAWVSVKAFFTRTPILHLSGPIAYHKFKKKFHYEVTWDEIWRNHALIARICFSEATWQDYWLPEVFQKHLNEQTQEEMDSDAVKAEHLEFQQIKVRPDHEFWTRLAFQKIPPAVKR